MEKASISNLYKHVDYLTTIRPYRSYKNLDTLKKCSNYITENFRELGLETRTQQWEAMGNLYENVIASYRPDRERKLIVGAHYDVYGEQPGADDNASAVAGLLETARLIATNQPELSYGIEFVAYCLEEPPFFATEYMGSYIHAESLSNADEDVIGMICYEMIGYFSNKPHSQSFQSSMLADSYPNVASFIMVVGIDEHSEFNRRVFQNMSFRSKIDVRLIDLHEKNELAGMSDHRNYWEFGYAALMINDTAFMRNPNYHTELDTIETLNFEKMAEVINSSYNAIVNMER